MSRPGRHVVVAGWSGTDNLGDELLLSVLLDELRIKGLHATVVSRRPAITETLHDTEAIGLGDLRALWRALGSADGLIVGPGTIIQDQTGPTSLPWHLARVPQAMIRHTPVVGVGLGIGPLRRWGSRRLTGAALRRCRAVAVRDQASAELLAACGVRHNVLVGADLVLRRDPPADRPPADHIAVCLRPHAERGHLIPLRHLPADSMDPSRIAALAGGLDNVAEQLGAPIRLVTMDAGRDAPFSEAVAAAMDTPAEVVVPDLNTVVDEIASARLVVAMRYHAGIAALLAGRPMVLIGYADKVTNLASQIGSGAVLVPDNPTGYGDLAGAAAQVEHSGPAVVEARDRLRPLAGVHVEALDRLVE